MAQLNQHKVVIVAPTCFYYQAELFREVANNPRIDLTVYFCSDEGITGVDTEIAYRTNNNLEIETTLLAGYKSKFLKNHAPNGSYLKSLVGLANLGVWKQISQDRPDVVIIMSWMNPTWWLIILACIKHRIPTMFMTDANFHSEKLKKPWKSWIKRKLLGNLIFSHISGFLCAGDANRRLYTHFGVPPERLFPFAYSWGYKKFLLESNELKNEKEALRKQYGFPSDTTIFLYCGRLSSEKGVIELLRAYEKVPNDRKALVLVGDGPLRDAMKEIVAEYKLDTVYFMGYQNRNDIGKFYTLADILVLPSIRETWGMVVNEALCFSLPIIASDQVGAGVDLVTPQRNGYIFPAGDISALTNQLSKVLNLTDEDWLKMRNHSRRVIEDWTNRDIATILAEHIDTLKSAQA